MKQSKLRIVGILTLTLILCTLPSLALAQADSPSVTVSDQESDAKSVTVAQVVAVAPGWMVIHIDEGGQPGPMLGQAPVQAGVNDNVVVNLDTMLAADTGLWAMLHVDQGQVGVYEFPGPDAPVIIDGAVVMTPFTAAYAGEMMADDAMMEGDKKEDTAMTGGDAMMDETKKDDAAMAGDDAMMDDSKKDEAAMMAPEVLPVTGGGLASVALNTLPLVTALGALAASTWATRRRQA